jgi:DNA-directed RNA polymerase specialized sigma24 family protein
MEDHLPHDDDLTAQLLALRPDVARRVARRRYGGRLEDKTQEAVLRAHRRLGSYRPSVGPLRPWVLGIAANVDRTFRRAERRYRAVFWPDLGEGERELLVRHHVLGETCAELAAWLGLSRAGAGARLRAAEERMRGVVRRYGETGEERD